MHYSRFTIHICYLWLSSFIVIMPYLSVNAADTSLNPVRIEILSADCQTESNLIDDTCLKQAYIRVDTHLNDLYKQIVRYSVIGNYIRPSQRAWILFRDYHCNAWQTKKSPIKSQAVKNHCLTILTNERLYTLQNHILAQQPYPDSQFTIQDRRLNQVYKQYKSQLSSFDKQQLVLAQRAWLVFRDASCPSKQNQCLAYFTSYRIIGLQQLYAQKTSSTTHLPVPKTTTLIDSNKLAMNLLGIWKQQAVSNNTILEFGIRNGIHHYLLRLDQLPFEAGQWQLQGNSLNLIDSDGTQRHSYRNIRIERGILTVTGESGNSLSFQRVGAN